MFLWDKNHILDTLISFNLCPSVWIRSFHFIGEHTNNYALERQYIFSLYLYEWGQTVIVHSKMWHISFCYTIDRNFGNKNIYMSLSVSIHYILYILYFGINESLMTLCRVHEIQTWPAQYGQILQRTDTRFVFSNRKLMKTDIFFTRTTKHMQY
jgi:hypothetical protein